MIGIFDSGVGGLSVWREIVRLLPDVPLLYLADQAHCPYGERTLDEVRAYAHGITAWLIERGARMIVVACNSASAAALYSLRERFAVPIVGMEPAIKPAAERTRCGRVGVLATPTTFQGEPYMRLLARYAKGIQVVAQPCPGWVEWVESGRLHEEGTMEIVRQALLPMQAVGVDEIVLGCTHYPFLRPWIERLMGPSVEVIDPALPVARQVQRVWQSLDVTTAPPDIPSHQFTTTGDVDRFGAQIASLVGWKGTVAQARWHGDELV
ncbi:MAG: glutamate racemase [Anaerolineae bacterium]